MRTIIFCALISIFGGSAPVFASWESDQVSNEIRELRQQQLQIANDASSNAEYARSKRSLYQ